MDHRRPSTSPHLVSPPARVTCGPVAALLVLACGAPGVDASGHEGDPPQRALVAVAGMGAKPGVEAAYPQAPDRTGKRWNGGYALLSTRGGLHAILGDSQARKAAHGPLRLLASQDHVVHARAHDGDLDPDLLALRGGTVEVVTDEGAVCEARVGGLDYRVDLIPDGYEWELWEELPTAEQRAEAIWRSAYSRSVSAQLRLTSPQTCAGQPLFMRERDGRSLQVARPLQEVPDRATLMAAFRALPRYQAIQAEYLREDGLLPERTADEPSLWEDYERTPSLQAFRFEDGVTYVSIAVPEVGCSAWDPALWAVFELGADQPPKLVHSSQTLAPYGVRLMLRQSSGDLQYIVDEGYRGTSAVTGQQRLASWAPEFHGCGC